MRPAVRRLAILREGGAEMPRQRPRRRRRRSAAGTGTAQVTVAEPHSEPAEQPSLRRWLPSAGIVTGTGVGIWLGLAFGGAGGWPADIALWVGVLMAGLGGGRIFRRSLQSRMERRR